MADRCYNPLSEASKTRSESHLLSNDRHDSVFLCILSSMNQSFFFFFNERLVLKLIRTLSMRDSSMLFEYSFSLNSSRSIRELSMSAER